MTENYLKQWESGDKKLSVYISKKTIFPNLYI
jgi:hypothetical protein